MLNRNWAKLKITFTLQVKSTDSIQFSAETCEGQNVVTGLGLTITYEFLFQGKTIVE
jgi:hypothetical protein